MALSDTFQQFTDELRDRLQAAKAMGMSEQNLTQQAENIGDYLSQYVEPKSPEQRLLKEMWNVADPREQQVIANCMVKLVEHRK